MGNYKHYLLSSYPQAELSNSKEKYPVLSCMIQRVTLLYSTYLPI